MLDALYFFSYLVLAGAVFRPLHNYISANYGKSYADFTPILVIVWPITIALTIGLAVGSLAPSSRTARRRKREKAEAEHRLYLALKNEELTKTLERSAGFGKSQSDIPKDFNPLQSSDAKMVARYFEEAENLVEAWLDREEHRALTYKVTDAVGRTICIKCGAEGWCSCGLADPTHKTNY